MCKYDGDAFCFMCGEFVKVRDIKYELNKYVKLCEGYEAVAYSESRQAMGTACRLKILEKFFIR